MNGLNERRRERRYRMDAPIIIQTFSGFDYHRAKESNHCNNGVSFEASVVLKPGAIVYIRREKCPENCQEKGACGSCRTTTLATVKWCNKNKAAGLPFYSVGAKYFEYGV